MVHAKCERLQQRGTLVGSSIRRQCQLLEALVTSNRQATPASTASFARARTYAQRTVAPPPLSRARAVSHCLALLLHHLHHNYAARLHPRAQVVACKRVPNMLRFLCCAHGALRSVFATARKPELTSAAALARSDNWVHCAEVLFGRPEPPLPDVSVGVT